MAVLLAAPLGYWRIRHPMKRSWDFAFPVLGSLGLTAAIRFWPAVPAPFSPDGYIVALQNLYAILGGFFVAALTLVAMAESPMLMRPVAGFPPITYAKETVPLSRRRFLSLLFGYLAFSSFALYVVGFAVTLAAPGFREIVPTEPRWWGATALMLGYNFWLSHTFVATLVGLYYFTDRLQRPDVQFDSPPGTASPGT